MKPLLCIATPAYGGMVHTDWHDSIMSMHQAGIEVITVCLGNESLITRARNTLIRIFYEQLTRVDRLFFLDADCGIDGRDVLSMMNSQYDVIGAPVALKGVRPDGSPVLNIDDPKNLGNGYFEVKHLGNAAMMLSRKAVTSLIDNAIQNGDVYVKTSMEITKERQQTQEGQYYDVFKTSIDPDGIYLSEDYHVCRTLQQLGYKVVVDPRVKTRHNGNYVFLS